MALWVLEGSGMANQEESRSDLNSIVNRDRFSGTQDQLGQGSSIARKDGCPFSGYATGSKGAA